MLDKEIFPIFMMLLALAAAGTCAYYHEYKRAVFWFAVAVAISAVTF